MTFRLRFLAMALILVMLQGRPKMCTGRIARVFSLIFSSILSGLIRKVSGSVSAKTGRATALRTTL